MKLSNLILVDSPQAKHFSKVYSENIGIFAHFFERKNGGGNKGACAYESLRNPQFSEAGPSGLDSNFSGRTRCGGKDATMTTSTRRTRLRKLFEADEGEMLDDILCFTLAGDRSALERLGAVGAAKRATLAKYLDALVSLRKERRVVCD